MEKFVFDRFEVFASWISANLGSPYAFLVALALVVVWAITGPFFHFNESWQLVINTGTTIITFLMVFLIQNTQNRDANTEGDKLEEILETNKMLMEKILELEKKIDQQ